MARLEQLDDAGLLVDQVGQPGQHARVHNTFVRDMAGVPSLPGLDTPTPDTTHES